ncbi:MAG: glutamyl-tRNA reductase [Gemmatimonadota bacterium]
MGLGVVGLTHRTAPIEVRERFFVTERALGALIPRLCDAGGLDECLVLSTCNRTECYFTADTNEEVSRGVVGLLAATAECSVEAVLPLFRTRWGLEAVLHLYRVVAGVDSLVIGEPQIQGQAREAYEVGRRLAPGSVGATLHRLFQSALSAGGQVRAATGISEGSASIPSAAVELARKVFGSLEGRRVAVVGAGKMGALTLRCLRDAGVEELMVASRTYRHASATAERQEGVVPLAYREVLDRLPEVELLVTSAAAPHVVVTAEQLQAGRPAGSPLVILDIAVPRNVEPAAGELQGVFLYNIDDLQRVVEAAEEARAAELPAAEAIIAEHARRFWSWYRARLAAPLIRDMRERAERIRQEELEAVLEGMEELSQEERRRIHMASRAALSKILHPPTAALRELAEERDGEVLLDVARRLLGLSGSRDSEEGDDDEG